MSIKTVEKITGIPMFPRPLYPGYNHTHPNLEFIGEGSDRVATMFYKLNDEPDVLLYSHGNASDIGHTHEILSHLAYLIGINIITYDYPGYGLSGVSDPVNHQIEPTEKGCIRAIDQVYNHLITQGSDPEHIILYGASIGTGPTVDLGSRTPGLRGVVLQTPFTCFGSFNSEIVIKNITCPVIIIHGKMDEIIPYFHGVLLTNILLKEGKKVRLITFEHASHNNIWSSQDYQDTIVGAIVEIIDSIN